ncbi:LacI family DNA-binding transcriptional regulator [Enterococcus timonensis]|uniref:LacI family DNA-binding transcriptional regulator n=1 Tax=Enterococcus timonensis TaxID=1852364 RepID=UPI0008D98A80|nr:LacI family DNA-binding transcriptional regulator [Enterococcus timonensis]
MATLADVAKRANVSKMTVSRVINHPEQVTVELKELVFAAMKELNYQPNIAAKALVNNRSQIIKLLILEEIDVTEPYYVYLLIGIAKAAEKAHYSLQVVTDPLVDIGTCDGYIITGFRQEDFEWIKALTKPVILFGENEEGIDFVDSNNNYGTVIATNHALECGYEHLIYIGIDVPEVFERSRENGYQEVMDTVEKPSKILRFANRSTLTEHFIKEHWTEFAPNTCFICSSDRLAIGVERGILARGGRIPEDFGIIGFDGVFLDQVSSPKLTTLKQAITKMGEVCGEMLVKKIDENGASQGFRRFLPQLKIRQTTK